MCTIYLSDFEESKTKKHQNEHAAGLRLLSYALKDYAKISMTEEMLAESIQTGPHGKPFLKSHPHICYNISHCRDMAACAISDSPVGVDLERIQSFHESILRKSLTDKEQAFLNERSQNADTRWEWFFRFWTLKESYLKFTGEGLSVALTDFSFSFDLRKNPYEISCSRKGVFFTQYTPKKGYILSLCTSKPAAAISLRTI